MGLFDSSSKVCEVHASHRIPAHSRSLLLGNVVEPDHLAPRSPNSDIGAWNVSQNVFGVDPIEDLEVSIDLAHRVVRRELQQYRCLSLENPHTCLLLTVPFVKYAAAISPKQVDGAEILAVC